MAIKKVISIGNIQKHEWGIDLTKHLTPNERVSLLEELRKQTYLAIKHEYPGTFYFLLYLQVDVGLILTFLDTLRP
jgi:hypothetical protein